jgi:tape measure domain-containing protein
MPFASLSAGERIRVILELLGGAEYVAKTDAASAATAGFGERVKFAGDQAVKASKKTFAFQQGIFTLRRIAFYSTLALGALGFEAIKMGLSFDASMQNATIAFQGFLPNARAIKDELHGLYVYAAQTPFQFPDLVIATRRLLPFIGNVKVTNQTVRALSDSLAAAGTPTGPALTRATLQIAHMANVGRLTGQILLSLGRDNIPMMKALQAAFHKTGAEIRAAISSGAIDAQTALTALIQYTQTTPGYINKAVEFSRHSVTGAFSTFKDLVRFAFGSSTTGVFNGALSVLNKINDAILPLVKGNKPVTITNLAQAIDRGLTPKTHILINTFIALQTTLKDVYSFFKTVAGVVSSLANAFDYLTGKTHSTGLAARTFGHILGGVVIVILLAEAKTILLRNTLIVLSAGVWLANTAWIVFTGRLLFAEKEITVVQTLLYKLRLAIIATSSALWDLIGPFIIAFGWEIAIVAVTLILAGALIYLYFKWKWFHDLVNSTIEIMWKYWYILGLLTLMIPIFGPYIYIIGLLVKYWKYVKDAIEAVVSAVQTLFHWFTRLFNINTKGGVLGVLERLGGIVTNPVGSLAGAVGLHFQAGGIMPTTGMAIVGEHGPEVVHLPAGSRISPRPNTDSVFDPQATSSQPITIQLVLNRRVLEEAIVDIQQRRNGRS